MTPGAQILTQPATRADRTRAITFTADRRLVRHHVLELRRPDNDLASGLFEKRLEAGDDPLGKHSERNRAAPCSAPFHHTTDSPTEQRDNV